MKKTDDMFFWYNNPPYLRFWAKFTSEAAQLDEKEKAEKNSLPEHRRKLNEWKFMGPRGRIYSEFKGGVKKPYNYQEKFAKNCFKNFSVLIKIFMKFEVFMIPFHSFIFNKTYESQYIQYKNG